MSDEGRFGDELGGKSIDDGAPCKTFTLSIRPVIGELGAGA